jgi:hypothetical protein
MAFAVFISFTFYIDPYPISASLTMLYIPLFALFLTFSCYTPVLFTFLIIATFAMFIRPTLFTFTCRLTTVWRFFSTVFIATVTTENTGVIGTVPILWAFRIVAAIISNPNTPVVFTFVSRFTVRIGNALFALTRALTAMRCSSATVHAISTSFHAIVHITIFVLGA